MSHNLQVLPPAARRHAGSEIDPPIMSAAEQTRFSWARLVRSVDELPPVYRPFIESLPADGAFPYAVLTPTFAGFMRREPEKLVCSAGDYLYVTEKVKDKLITTCYAFTDIHYLEAGAVLLNDWLQIRGCTGDGAFAVTRFKFNAVTERLFTPFIEKIRGAANDAPRIDRDAELKKFDTADLLSFKFKNYARRSIMPGAQFVASVGQPEIRQTIVKVLRYSFRRTVATAHLLILTERELIVIQDDPDSPRSLGETHYGGVWNYIPLRKIIGVNQRDQENGRRLLTVQLPQNDHVEVLFQPDRFSDLARFVDQLKSRLPAAS